MISLRTLILLISILLSIVVVYSVRSVVHDETLAKIKQDASRDLDIQALNARSFTDKYAVTAKLLAGRSDVIYYFNCKTCEFLEITKLINRAKVITGAKSVWFVDITGDVMLTSDPVLERKNIRENDYFLAALQGRLGRENVVDEVDGRSYLFAAPVFKDNKIIGVTVILVGMASIEASWALIQHPIIALNQDKQVFLSNVKKWRLLNLMDDSNTEEKDGLFDKVNDKKLEGIVSNQFQMGDVHRFLLTEKYVPLLDWNIIAMKDYSILTGRVNNATVNTLIGLSLLWLVAWYIWNRNQRIVNERNQQIQFANLLEKRVQRRTQAVSIANENLESEIEERKSAEMELRRTQKELIQAAKMASIGQMSTVLAHEYNQPISAIQFYADSAKKLFKESREEDGFDNLERIQQLTQRMSMLTNSLRNFAHKPKLDLKEVDVEKVANQLMVLMQPLAKSENVEITIHRPDEQVTAIAGDTRLTQILSNLMANSISALKQQEHKMINLEWRVKDDDFIEIIVRDNGPGIKMEMREDIFEAFYTNNNSGEGLGLGLFIVYNLVNEIGGTLNLVDEEGFGAVFVLELKRY